MNARSLFELRATFIFDIIVHVDALGLYIVGFLQMYAFIILNAH